MCLLCSVYHVHVCCEILCHVSLNHYFFCIHISLVMLSKSEACLTGQSPVPSSGFGDLSFSSDPCSHVWYWRALWAGQCWRMCLGRSGPIQKSMLWSLRHVTIIRNLLRLIGASMWHLALLGQSDLNFLQLRTKKLFRIILFKEPCKASHCRHVQSKDTALCTFQTS